MCASACMCVCVRDVYQGTYGVGEFIKKIMCISWLIRDRTELTRVGIVLNLMFHFLEKERPSQV